jgi:glyceraldehyde 3-phosphate dehydrogenase
VPTPNVSIVDLVAEVEREATFEDINQAMHAAAAGALEGVLDVSDDQLVSVDYVGNPASSIVDSRSTFVIQDRLVKVVAWYDNEWGYSTRCVDLAGYIAERM